MSDRPSQTHLASRSLDVTFSRFGRATSVGAAKSPCRASACGVARPPRWPRAPAWRPVGQPLPRHSAWRGNPAAPPRLARQGRFQGPRGPSSFFFLLSFPPPAARSSATAHRCATIASRNPAVLARKSGGNRSPPSREVIYTFVSCNVMMVCLVRWFHGGVVKENGEFENMKDVTRMFEVAPCLHEIVEYARSHFSCGVDDEISLKGRVDCGRGRAAYALVDLKSDVEWDQFKRLVEQSSVPYLDVVVTSRKTASREGGRELVAQLGTQESTISQLGIGVIQQEQLQSKGTEFADDSDSETFSFDETEPGTAHDYFPNDVFEREEAKEDDDDDDISEGSDGGDDNDGMAHPRFPLLELEYDDTHRAHMIADQNMVLPWLRTRVHAPMHWDSRYAPFVRTKRYTETPDTLIFVVVVPD
ncbi:hypothetical protein HU200_027907 [Digitaria exilis]|uniref:Uncharacterized protein n=1 Tax=Digitaria exilis TaxID=1010633 RepID=A0A835EVZ2_9POAL|nr:hypothetical protein HU200_027907 [Digitaria exilis]